MFKDVYKCLQVQRYFHHLVLIIMTILHFEQIYTAIELWVKFAKCQAHIMSLRVDKKKDVR